MMRTNIVKHLRPLALGSAALLALGACSAHKPVAEMARAEQAVQHAETTSEAERLAPVELTSAQTKLAAARRAMDDHDYTEARRLAEDALADAQLAESKAESQLAREQAARTRQDIQTLQTEVVSPSTVVVEKRSVQSTVPTNVIVEQPAPPTAHVVVEQPAPPPSSVVVQHETPVVVIPGQ